MKQYNIPIEATLEIIGKVEGRYFMSLNERDEANE